MCQPETSALAGGAIETRTGKMPRWALARFVRWPRGWAITTTNGQPAGVAERVSEQATTQRGPGLQIVGWADRL